MLPYPKCLEMNPVCLFPTRKQCDDVNADMLSRLDTEKHEIPCIDEVDETKSTTKWHKKAAEQLDKLNKDCNNTAGLEVNLKLAVGARVMLRRNIDTKAGLVNGAIGTIQAISARCISVKFDHINDPFDIEKLKGKFMVMKNYYIYRKQFPLILAYAVTIHKCQGLSLDCAIVDLSSKIFADGMAYVALSRVKSLAGLHLISLDNNSIKVNTKCLKEVNRLRELYRKDLPLYDIPTASSHSKRKLTGSCELDKPVPKQRRTSIKSAEKSNTKNNTKKNECSNLSQADKPHTDPGSQLPRTWPFKFHSVDEQWQRGTCASLGFNFKKTNGVAPGSVSLPLTCPDQQKVKSIMGDGNCMFRSLSYVITGSENQHKDVRAKIVQHMKDIAPLMLGHIKGYYPNCSSVQEYIVQCNGQSSFVIKIYIPKTPL